MSRTSLQRWPKKRLLGVISSSAQPCHQILRKQEYFGQYGKIVKIVINRGTVHHTSHGQSVSAYVTFQKKADALACIHAVDGAVLDNRLLRASFGTTKCARRVGWRASQLNIAR
jgi:hypothetical protein